MFDCPAALTGALDQFGCHHKCSSTVDSGHHSLRWCHVLLSLTMLFFFVCDHVVFVQNLSCMYVLVCGCSGRSVCRQCWTVQLLSRVLWTNLAAITSALVQWTATIHCAGVMYYYHSQMFVHQVRMLPMQHPISLKFRCVFLHLALSRVVSHLAPTQRDD